MIQAATILFLFSTAVPQTPEDAGELKSASIVDAVEEEFFADVAVPYHSIDLELADGVLRMTGSVADLRAKERAARIAETVKGVRAVVNLIEVRDSGLPDEQISGDVVDALVSDPATESYEVDVLVHDGHVALSGTVDSWQEKELVEIVARGVSGVRGVTNDVTIAASVDRSDHELRTEIESALRWNVLVDDGLIGVAVEDGVVRLDGTVGSAAEKRQARNTAWVSGVVEVDDDALQVARWARDDDLRSTPYPDVDDAHVRSALKDALARDPRVRAYSVDASVLNGVVTLRGVVGDLKARFAAEEAARHTVGAISVRNHLKVRPELERSNEAIEEDVQEAFLRDPVVDRFDTTIVVDDGTVYLHGAVGSSFEKHLATDLASRVVGVTDVVNLMRVEGLGYVYDPFVDYGFVHRWEYRPATFTTNRSDRSIRMEIEDELFWSPFVDADEVEVSVDDGKATLEGTVDSWMEWGAAQENAYEGGATEVDNDLVVANGRSTSTAQRQ